MSGKAGGFGTGRGLNAALAAVNYESRMLKELDQMMLADVKQRNHPQQPGGGGGATYVSIITLSSGKTAQVRFADANSQSAAEQLLRDLAQAKGAAS